MPHVAPVTLPPLRVDAVLHADDGVAEHRGDLDGARATEVIGLDSAIADWKPAGRRGRRAEERRGPAFAWPGGARSAARTRETGRRGRERRRAAAAAQTPERPAESPARAGGGGGRHRLRHRARRAGRAVGVGRRAMSWWPAAPTLGRRVSSASSRDADRELDAGLADDDRVAGLELRLVDLLAVDEGALGRAEVDDAHVTGAVDLDDRVHTADRLVIELEVRRGHLAELDDGQAQPLLADQLIAFVDA